MAVFVSLALAVAAAGGCGSPVGGPSPSPSPSPGSGTSVPSGPGSSPATTLLVGLGFVPSVQFAQFYLADQAGYYRDAGLAVTLENKIDSELIPLIGQGAVDVGMGDGTSVIPAVGHDIPIRYVATIYARFPSVVFAKASSGITDPADLAGRKLGIPGRYGSSWIMLQALLDSAGLTPADLEIVEYPRFTQGAAVQQDQVEAATGFVNNEPVQLELAGIPVEILRVDEITPLPGPGLVVGASTIERKRDALRAFVAATLRAMEEVAADPEVGLDAAIARVPELGQDRDTQRAILDATIETWSSPYTREHGTGAIDRDAWTESVDFMRSLPDTDLSRPLTVDELVTEELLDG